jgi:DNA-binding response OmpR family regulator
MEPQHWRGIMSTNNPSILLVDDEFQVLDMLKEWLEDQDYQVSTADSAESALKLFYEVRPTLSIIDLRMPGMNGFQLIRRIRELSESPVMVLSALGEDVDQVRGLDVGADEYVIKPVSREPFLARVRSLLRRAPPAEETTAHYRDAILEMDTPTHTVTVEGQTIHVSPLEFRLLAYLVDTRHRIATHAELLSEVWDTELGSQDSLKWYVSSLRRKLEASTNSHNMIRSVRGLGYQYVPPGGL